MADTTTTTTAAADTETAWARLRRFLDRWLIPYLPYPHFMALAPLDVVFRLLYRPFAWIPVVYWPRLAFLLFCSTFATVLTLPERLVVAAWLRLRPPPIPRHQAPVFVLGYFRSGTTFLQSLLAADPMLRAPRWAEALLPQSFVIGWTVTRYLLIPFLPLARVDEVMPLAPTFPAEDDFALNNWGLVSIMPGRAVLPQLQPFYDRYNDLDSLTAAELSRWRTYQRRFIEKLMLIAGGRRLVLKSPSHTARVRYLLDLFPGAKFVHISRPPTVVFQSNILLAQTLQGSFGLQFPIAAEAQEEIIADEYLASERHYLEDRALIPPGDLVEVRLQDVAADPIGQLRHIYREWGLPCSAVFEQRVKAMLCTPDRRTPNVHAPLSEAQKGRAARLAPLVEAFGHDRPPIAKVMLPVIEEQPRDAWAGVMRGLFTTLAAIACWYAFDRVFPGNHAILVWPVGVLLGYAVLGAERSRSPAMGTLAAVLSVVALLALLAANAVAIGLPLHRSTVLMILNDIVTTDAIFWTVLAGAIAYWIASGRPA
jgi:hypothetical protein